MNVLSKKNLIPAVIMLAAGGMAITKTDMYKNYQQQRFESDKEKGEAMLYEGCDNRFERLMKTVEIEFKAKLHFQSTDEYIVETYREKIKKGFWEDPKTWLGIASISALLLYGNARNERRKEGNAQYNKINRNV